MLSRVRLFCGFCCSVLLLLNALADGPQNEDYEELLRKGDKAVNQENWDGVEYYWQAAAMGVDKRAISKLGVFYSFPWSTAGGAVLSAVTGDVSSAVAELVTGVYYGHLQKKFSFDEDIPARYLAKVADADFARRRRHARKYEGVFFIVATESGIVDRLGVKELSATFNRSTCCERAVENLYKRMYVDGENGRLFMRAVKLGEKLGTVAVVDRDSALRHFKFTESPITDWVVYVRSPANPRTLIPFNDFHRYVYEEKMGAFHKICCHLGASSASVYYQKTEKSSIATDVRVDGADLKSYAKASAEVQAAVTMNTGNTAKSDMTFNGGEGSRFVNKISSPWLDRERTWHDMCQMRLNKENPLTYCDARFDYTDDFNVNVVTNAAFENLDYKISGNASAQFNDFTKMIWVFRVKFPKSVTILPGTVEL